jgi:hypothetical protein
MRHAMIAIPWILVVITAPSYGRAQEFAPAIRHGEHRLPFEARDDLIYIHAVVNGNRTTLLVETGHHPARPLNKRQSPHLDPRARLRNVLSEQLLWHVAKENPGAFVLVTAHSKFLAIVQNDLMVAVEPGVDLFHFRHVHDGRAMDSYELPGMEELLDTR